MFWEPKWFVWTSFELMGVANNLNGCLGFDHVLKTSLRSVVFLISHNPLPCMAVCSLPPLPNILLHSSHYVLLPHATPACFVRASEQTQSEVEASLRAQMSAMAEEHSEHVAQIKQQ
eukprot:1158079-Pelagomonas_calceolata.AAC.4